MPTIGVVALKAAYCGTRACAAYAAAISGSVAAS